MMTNAAYALPDSPVSVDEVGIRYGVMGDARLKTRFQPLFSVNGDMIHVGAVSATGAIQRAGRTVTEADLATVLSSEQQARIASIFQLLHPHNLLNTFDSALDLHMSFEATPATAAMAAAELLGVADAAGVDPGRLVCDLSGLALASSAVFGGIASLMRARGARIALDMPAAGVAAGDSVSLPRPDVVRLPAIWFQLLCRDAAGTRLVGTTIGALHARGTQVRVEGIETAWHLKIAVDCGADLLQGPLLGAPALAGSAFNDDPRALASLLGEPAAILRLFGR